MEVETERKEILTTGHWNPTDEETKFIRNILLSNQVRTQDLPWWILEKYSSLSPSFKLLIPKDTSVSLNVDATFCVEDFLLIAIIVEN
uniref:Uncharacterized protein n=1 Tax=Rhizophagus irregularis (strain DAOM 181602 / DAOM 197198 / MUCL 43194) TaxID=747089 RepID=U9TY41_RHIID